MIGEGPPAAESPRRLALLGVLGLTPVSYAVAGLLAGYGSDRLFMAAGALMFAAALALARPLLKL